MRVIADENMPALDLWRNAGHEVSTFPGRLIGNQTVRDAEVLLVRSVTPVNASLIANTALRFVGSATSGTDHVDQQALLHAGIAFSHAPGANAQSVVDYVFSVLAALHLERRFNWLNATIGIIGCGQIGGRLFSQLQALGVKVIVHDPFLAEDSPIGPCLRSLQDVLRADVITLHTPLTIGGEHPTRHLIGARALSCLSREQVLISAGRGEVVDNQALLDCLGSNTGPLAVLDVWENEPDYSRVLAKRVWLGTPHIAGYSHEGKVRGTQMLLEAFEGGAHAESTIRISMGVGRLRMEAGSPAEEELSRLILQAYDVRTDALRFRSCDDAENHRLCFDQQRRSYPQRHEFSAFTVEGAGAFPALEKPLRMMGFRLV